MPNVIVPEHLLLTSRISDCSSDVCASELVGKDDAAGQYLRQCRKCRVIGYIAAGKEQRAFLAMQVGKFRFQIDVVMCVATDIARAARSRPDIVQRLFHGFHDRGMLPHGEIIVGAPHCDRLWPIMSGKAARIGKGTLRSEEHTSEPQSLMRISYAVCA